MSKDFFDDKKEGKYKPTPRDRNDCCVISGCIYRPVWA